MTCPRQPIAGRRRPLRTESAITERQAQLCAFIASFTEREKHAPGWRDLMRYFGWTSTNSVACALKPLKQKRLADWKPGGGHSLHLTESGKAVAEDYVGRHPEEFRETKLSQEGARHG